MIWLGSTGVDYQVVSNGNGGARLAASDSKPRCRCPTALPRARQAIAATVTPCKRRRSSG